MKPARKLALKRETLTELAVDDLSVVAGAALSGLSCGLPCPTNPCSDFAECIPSRRCLTGTTTTN